MGIGIGVSSSSNRIRRLTRQGVEWGERALDWLIAALAASDPPRSARWLGWSWMFLLLVGGGMAWYSFLNGGAIDFTRHDWIEAGHRLAFLQDAARKGVLPLHMPGSWALRNVTDRFISVADTNLSPQVFLLRFLDIGKFVLVNTWILFTTGFVGLLLLRRRFRWSVLVFTAVFLLLFFGGHVVVHMGVGHVHWATYFLVPYFLWLIFDLLDGPRRPWRWTLLLSAYMAAILLQGAFHLFSASVFFLGVLALAHPERFGLIVRGIFFATLLGAVRILPPLPHAGEFDTAFLSGFATADEMLEALLRLVPPSPDLALRSNLLGPLGWWELDYFVGVVGLALISGFAIYHWARGDSGRSLYRRLVLPIALMIFFSFGQFYKVFEVLQAPLLSTQRVSSRLLYLPVAVLVVLAAQGFQALLDRRSTIRSSRIVLALGVGLLAQDLWVHLRSWRVANMPALFTSDPVDLSLDVVANHPDPAYTTLLIAGVLISALTLALLGILVWREARTLLAVSDGATVGQGPLPSEPR